MSKLLMNGLNSLFTSFVTNYLNKGYIISIGTMSGSYSNEIGHVDLTNPKDPTVLIRIWMLREHHSIFKSRLPDAIKIVVKQYEFDKTNWHTYWDNDGVELESVAAYEIEKDKCYTLLADEALEIVQLRSKRWNQKPSYENNYKRFDKNSIPQSVKDSIMNRIRSIRGCKKATIDCIDRIEFNKYSTDNHRKCYITWKFNSKSGCIVLH